MRRWLWVAVITACAACGSKTEPGSGSGSGSGTASTTHDADPWNAGSSSIGTPRLYTDAELARLEADVMARLEENRRRQCKREVLRGTADPRSGRDALLAFYEPQGALGICVTRLVELAKRTSGGLRDVVETRTPEVLAAARTCRAPLEDVIEKTRAYEDACSPYQVGVRANRGFVGVLATAHVIGLLARQRAEGGDVGDGLWLVLDAARVYQDLGRGHVNMIDSMVATAGLETVLSALQPIANSASGVPPAELDRLAIALDRLLAAEPPYFDMLQGERDSVDLYLGVSHFKPDGWEPPGGWDEEMRDLAKDNSLLGPRITKQDIGALMLAMNEVMAPRVAKACPRDAALADCHRGIARLAADGREAAESAKDIDRVHMQMFLDAARGAASSLDDSRANVRARIVVILAGVTQSAFESYPSRRASSMVRIAMARLHVEVLRTVARTGRCPTAGELTAAPFRGLASPALLGDTLAITRDDLGIRITAPAWVTSKRPAWWVYCRG